MKMSTQPPLTFTFDPRKRTARPTDFFGDAMEMEAPQFGAPTQIATANVPSVWGDGIEAPAGYNDKVRDNLIARRKKRQERALSRLQDLASHPEKFQAMLDKRLSTAAIDPKDAFERYRQYIHGDNKLVKRTIGKGLPSAAERQRMKEERAARALQIFGTKYPKPEDMAEAIRIGRKYYQAASGRARPPLSAEEKLKRQQKQYLHMVYPNAIQKTKQQKMH